jgi:hypothetical protein
LLHASGTVKLQFIWIILSMDATNVVEIPGFLSNSVVKKIVFDVEGVTIENSGKTAFIPAERINAFRYGVNFTRGYSFVFGRQYFIEVKDFQNKIFKIKLNSFYGIKRNAYYEAWSAVFKQLWNHYFVNMLHYYIDLYTINQPFELAGINFDVDGISWDKKNKLAWKDVAISNYRTYFMIYNSGNPKQNKSCNFASDWNGRILQVLLKAIVRKHQMPARA